MTSLKQMVRAIRWNEGDMTGFEEEEMMEIRNHLADIVDKRLEILVLFEDKTKFHKNTEAFLKKDSWAWDQVALIKVALMQINTVVEARARGLSDRKKGALMSLVQQIETNLYDFLKKERTSTARFAHFIREITNEGARAGSPSSSRRSSMSSTSRRSSTSELGAVGGRRDSDAIRAMLPPPMSPTVGRPRTPQSNRSMSPQNNRSMSPQNNRSMSPQNNRSMSPQSNKSASPDTKNLLVWQMLDSPSFPGNNRSMSPPQNNRSMSPQNNRSMSPQNNRPMSPPPLPMSPPPLPMSFQNQRPMSPPSRPRSPHSGSLSATDLQQQRSRLRNSRTPSRTSSPHSGNPSATDIQQQRSRLRNVGSRSSQESLLRTPSGHTVQDYGSIERTSTPPLAENPFVVRDRRQRDRRDNY